MMGFRCLLLIGAAAAAQSCLAAAPKAATNYAILTCDMASATDLAATERVFRIGPGSLQEWKPEMRAFGSNLCLAYTCAVEGERTTAELRSASLTLTLTLVRGDPQATWRTLGASGLARPQGTCAVGPDTLAGAAP